MQEGSKRLIVCCDGTWNEPDQTLDHNPADETEPTNVPRSSVELCRSTCAAFCKWFTTTPVYYDTGVGIRGFADKYLGGGLGIGLSENIQQAYRFIANNYVNGDELFLFGFSRGAYTVRSLAGFIGAVGLLEKEHLRCVPEAYALYRLSPDERHGSLPERRLKFLERPPRTAITVKFIGVWDTVGALGTPTPILGRLTRGCVSFHDTQLGKDVENAYQALAVDERRRPFQPNLWTGQPASHQTIEQVWFAGVHSNIGGGYRNASLAEIVLNWMVGRATQHGLEFAKGFSDVDPARAQEGRLEDSFTAAYTALRLLGVAPYRREIGPSQHGDIRNRDWFVPGESVHPSAAEAIGKRFSGNAKAVNYEPWNLKRALKKGLAIWSP